MKVAPQGLIDQSKLPPPRVARRQHRKRFAKVMRKVKGQPGRILRLQPAQLEQQVRQLTPLPRKGEMISQVVEEIAIVRAGPPTVWAAPSVGVEQDAVCNALSSPNSAGARRDAIVVNQIVKRQCSDAFASLSAVRRRFTSERCLKSTISLRDCRGLSPPVCCQSVVTAASAT